MSNNTEKIGAYSDAFKIEIEAELTELHVVKILGTKDKFRVPIWGTKDKFGGTKFEDKRQKARTKDKKRGQN